MNAQRSQVELLDLAESHERRQQAGDQAAEQQAAQVLGQMRPPGAVLAPMVGPDGAAQVWTPEGVRILHVYGLMRPTAALADLEAATRGIAGDLLAPVPRQWGHWTCARLEHADAAEATTIATALAEHLDDGPPPQGTGAKRWGFTAQATLHRHGILITPTGDAPPVTTLMQATAAALRRVDPDGQRTRTPRYAHSSAAYTTSAVRATTRREVAALSDRFGLRRLTIELEAVAVVWVTQDPAGPEYTWDTHTRIPLLRDPFVA